MQYSDLTQIWVHILLERKENRVFDFDFTGMDAGYSGAWKLWTVGHETTSLCHRAPLSPGMAWFPDGDSA